MSEALTTWTRGWYLCIEFKMVCKIMLSMTLINYDVGAGASSLKLQACGLVVELWKILLASVFFIFYNLYNLCRWMVLGSGWVSVGLVWAGREYAWEAPQMGLHHAWLALKDPAFLPTTSALSPSQPCYQAVFQVKVGSTLRSSHNVSFMIAICVWFCDKIKLSKKLTKKKCRQLTLTKPLLSEMLLVSFNLWKETTWKYFYLLLFS